jgi:hypothetical protein
LDFIADKKSKKNRNDLKIFMEKNPQKHEINSLSAYIRLQADG